MQKVWVIQDDEMDLVGGVYATRALAEARFDIAVKAVPDMFEANEAEFESYAREIELVAE